MSPIVTFGEIMCRLASPANLRLRQARELEVTYAGAEASVAASICNFGGVARFVTALPKHALAEATITAWIHPDAPLPAWTDYRLGNSSAPASLLPGWVQQESTGGMHPTFIFRYLT